jgi:hypothetical protein
MLKNCNLGRTGGLHFKNQRRGRFADGSRPWRCVCPIHGAESSFQLYISTDNAHDYLQTQHVAATELGSATFDLRASILQSGMLVCIHVSELSENLSGLVRLRHVAHVKTVEETMPTTGGP